MAAAKMAAKRSLLVIGGCGQLGRVVVSHGIKAGFRAVSVDLRENAEASLSVTLQRTDQDELDKLSQRLRASGDTQLDAIVNVAGGWAGGNLESQTLIKDFDNMVHVNLRSAFAAAYLASRHLSQRGLLVLTGAAAALNASPTMLAYGASKAAVHHLVRSLAEPGSGLPADAAVAAILPITIDTPSNRAAMPKADFSTWTPPEDIARTILSWTEDGKRPRSGGLYRFDTAANKTTVALVP